jgi:excisionase family DNA binding protein
MTPTPDTTDTRPGEPQVQKRNNQVPSEPVYTVAQIAAVLVVSSKTVLRMIERGEIEAFRLSDTSRSYRVTKTAWDKYAVGRDIRTAEPAVAAAQDHAAVTA